MTTRLLGRCARLLGARCPRASSAGTRLPPALAPAEPAWVQCVRLRPQVRALCERRSLFKEEEIAQPPKRTELDELVEKASSPQEILQLWDDHSGSANQAAITLIQLVKLAVEKGESDRANLLEDHRFQDMVELVSSQVATVWNGTLVSVLRALSLLGVPSGAPVLRSLQTEALWRVRRFTYRQLAYLAEWGTSRGGPQAEALLNGVVKQLELRWTELADARTASLLMARAGHRYPSLMDKLEDKALELAEGFSAEDIRRVAMSLASQGRRSVPLMRALSYHIQQKPSAELKTPLLLDLAFAYGKLNFHQSQVFQRIASELLPRREELTPSDVTRCAKSFAYLKWLHLPLFESFVEHYLENEQNYRVPQLCNLLLSLARLNFQPSKADEFYSKVHAALEGALLGLEPYLQTDVVWSLCVLQQAKPQYLKNVLDPAFQRKLTDDKPSRTESYRLKLLHITATAQLEKLCPPETSSSPTSPVPAPSRESRPTPLQTSLHEALQSLVGGRVEAYRTGVDTVYGWTIDGELVVDAENKPIDLQALVAPHLPGGGGASPLPQGARRIAFLAGEFPNYSTRSKELLGRFAMQRRHLQLAGFLTVEVPYFEWLELKSDWQRVAYLKDKMGKVVAEEMAK
ncbi:hypothetical protein MATL_G00134980 [Megalops atlanticus]|uniref:FAST kinase domain-containing protein 4 n=1 Tax=Megalops atlanticus TaxID=7932 RepID=A0A9D3Q1F5_MEGAT|nr:hypothetical protein MATL_G00134980 [Megalops atlanticus]